MKDNNAGGGFVGDADAVGIQVSRYESEDSSGASCSGGIYSTFDDVSWFDFWGEKFEFFFSDPVFFFLRRKKWGKNSSLLLLFLFLPTTPGLHPPPALRHAFGPAKDHLRRPGDDDGGDRHLRGAVPW